jgi:hypothetical protein
VATEQVSLDLLTRQQERLITDVAGLRDDMRVLTAIVLRQENTLNSVLDQLRAMVAQGQRTTDRVRKLEEKIDSGEG